MAKRKKKSVEEFNKTLQQFEEQSTPAHWDFLINLAREHLKEYPSEEVGYHLMGVALMKLGRFQEAVENYKKANKINVLTSDSFHNFAQALQEIGDYQYAIKMFNKAIEYEEISFFYNHRGVCHAEIGEYEKALADFNRAFDCYDDIDNESLLHEIYNNRGALYYDIGQYQDALNDLNVAVGLTENLEKNSKILLERTMNNRGNVYAALQKYNKAIQDYTEAIGIKPNYANAYYNRGLTYFDQQEIGRGIADLEKANELQPNSDKIRSSLKFGYELLGQFYNLDSTSTDEAEISQSDESNIGVLQETLNDLPINLKFIQNYFHTTNEEMSYFLFLYLNALYESTLKNILLYELVANQKCMVNEIKEKFRHNDIKFYIADIQQMIGQLLETTEKSEFKKLMGTNREKDSASNSKKAKNLSSIKQARDHIVHGNWFNEESNSIWKSVTKITPKKCVAASINLLEHLCELNKFFNEHIIQTQDDGRKRKYFNPFTDNFSALENYNSSSKLTKIQTKLILEALVSFKKTAKKNHQQS